MKNVNNFKFNSLIISILFSKSSLLTEGTTNTWGFSFTMIRRAEIGGSKTNITMNVWQRQEGVVLFKEGLGCEGLVKHLTLCTVIHGSLL